MIDPRKGGHGEVRYPVRPVHPYFGCIVLLGGAALFVFLVFALR